MAMVCNGLRLLGIDERQKTGRHEIMTELRKTISLEGMVGQQIAVRHGYGVTLGTVLADMYHERFLVRLESGTLRIYTVQDLDEERFIIVPDGVLEQHTPERPRRWWFLWLF